jgi:hypothetical protein
MAADVARRKAWPQARKPYPSPAGYAQHGTRDPYGSGGAYGSGGYGAAQPYAASPRPGYPSAYDSAPPPPQAVYDAPPAVYGAAAPAAYGATTPTAYGAAALVVDGKKSNKMGMGTGLPGARLGAGAPRAEPRWTLRGCGLAARVDLSQRVRGKTHSACIPYT